MTSNTEYVKAPSRRFIETLRPEEVGHLSFGVWSRSTPETALEAVGNYPGRSVWIPETLEYAIVAPWRHRTEIANVVELSAVRHPAELLRDVVRRASTLGGALVLAVELDERRNPTFYERAGFSLLERIVTYELDAGAWPGHCGGDLTFTPVDLGDLWTLPALVELDHATFPWLWWNSIEEFRAYAESPGVELAVAVDRGRPVAYVGITTYLGWGHLDRIAVLPESQGRGIGRQALDFAIGRLSQLGARRVGLSTQEHNVRSRRLYERAGFRHAVANDYRLYGRILRLPDGVSIETELI